MSKLPRKDKKFENDGAIDLKTRNIASHNQISPDERLIQLVKLLARRAAEKDFEAHICLLYTSPSPRDRTRSRMPSSA